MSSIDIWCPNHNKYELVSHIDITPISFVALTWMKCKVMRNSKTGELINVY